MAARLLAYVLLFSLLLSLVATGVQLIGEFERRKADLLNTQTKAAELVSGSMSNNIWLMNFSEVANSLDDMKAVPAIRWLRETMTCTMRMRTCAWVHAWHAWCR